MMTNKSQVKNISVEELATHLNAFTKTVDLVVSKQSYSLLNNAFDWEYPHIIEGIGFTFCTKGSATLNLNLTQYHICENMVGIISPNSVVQLLEQSQDFEVGFLLFSFDFISSINLTKEMGVIAAKVEKQPCFIINDEAFQEILTLHDFIVKQYEKNTEYSIDIVKSLLHTLIYLVLQFYSQLFPVVTNQKQSRHEDVYRRFMSLLFQNYKNQRTVGFYADQLFLTPKYFSKVIKTISGKTAGEWIDEMVIMGAKGMLKSSDLSVAQIADEFNFANPSFFGNYFKLKTGLTPLQYRES